jgi:glycosyltransferase involved in cell wall biosynthesis
MAFLPYSRSFAVSSHWPDNHTATYLMSLLEKFGFRKQPDASLIILDNIFPHLLSSFRVAEFNAYLATYEKAVAYSTGAAFSAIGEHRSFREVLDEYDSRYPELRGRTFHLHKKIGHNGELIYFVFLQNAGAFMDYLRRSKLPFVFTLYPGGGFRLDERHSDDTLRSVCALPNLKKVITTQKVSHEYLLKFLAPEKIEFIYGGVFPSDRLANDTVARKYYQQDKGTFDICFVAFKYMPRGVDKGYDVFVDVARRLSRLHNNIRFHVVGPYDESDVDVSDLKGRIEFYGVRQTEFFPQFYSEMDLILAPNLPFMLIPGAFDGFPTGGCIEAGLCGVAVFCTDPLNQNISFKEGEEIVIIQRDVEQICESVEGYYRDYDKLVRLGRRGQEAFKKAFAIETQLGKRLRILAEYLPPSRKA